MDLKPIPQRSRLGLVPLFSPLWDNLRDKNNTLFGVNLCMEIPEVNRRKDLSFVFDVGQILAPIQFRWPWVCACRSTKATMNNSRTHMLDETSGTLVAALRDTRDVITWADDIVDIYESIQQVYGLYTEITDAPEGVWALEDRVKELERYIVIDLERHLATGNGRHPYYIGRVHGHLERIKRTINERGTRSNGTRVLDSAQDVKECDHLVAELQATFMEYGFCHSYDALTDIGEITRRLTTLNVKLENIESSMMGQEGDEAASIVAINEIHDAIAQQHGIQQAATEENINKVQALYDKLSTTITRLENNVCRSKVRKDSKVFQKYLEDQRTLKKISIGSLYHSDPSETINSHSIHPGTRAWLMEAIHKWYANTDKSIFFLSGKTGTGKTALASHVCKLYGSDVIASHFFDKSEGGNIRNTVNGLIQSLAVEMCKTLPDYAAFLGEKYNGADVKDHLNGHWLSTYRALIKEPFSVLYASKAARRSRRRLIVIDALDEASQSEWTEMKHFLSTCMKEIPPCICIAVTVRSRCFSNLVPVDDHLVEGVRLEERAWQNQHIKDIEIYMSSSMGAILSGEDEVDAPSRAKADEHTMQNTMDELLKHSAGRFDYAIEVMESFARQMRTSQGQFLSSVKKSLNPLRRAHPQEFDNRSADFASPFRSYRDREGRSVVVRVMRQSLYPMDKTRVALIRARHRDLAN